MENKLMTQVQIPPYSCKTGYRKRNMFMGSCFAESIGLKMQEFKYNVDLNPFGIIYNPFSLSTSIKFLLEEYVFNNEDLIFHKGLWHSLYHHSRFSGITPGSVLDTINARIHESSGFLKNAGFIFITFGTAWVYEYKSTGRIISNCHKLPAGEFRRFRLGVDEIVLMFTSLLGELRKANPGIAVVFTVSPVRHWKDGAIDNQRSKATLLLAIEKILDNNNNCFYFPSYEIIMDELRDYRFYAEDMIHLNNVAVNYIWQVFSRHLIEEQDHRLSQEVEKILNARQHRPFNRRTKEYAVFLENSIKNIEQLAIKNPYLNLRLEREHFIKELNEIQQERDELSPN